MTTKTDLDKLAIALDAKRDQSFADIADTLFKTKPEFDKRANKDAALFDAENIANILDISEILTRAGVDPYQTYCMKTGRPCGQTRREIIDIMMKLHDLQHAVDVMQIGVQTTTALHWMDTSPDILRKLATIDPAGYYVYACSMAIRRSEPATATAKRDTDYAGYQRKFLLEKIALYGFVHKMDVATLRKANEAWRDFLALFSAQKIKILGLFPYEKLLEFANAGVIENLPQSLKKITMEVFRREASFASKSYFTYSDAIALSNKFQGNSAFRMQGGAAGQSNVDQLYDTLSEFGWDDAAKPHDGYEKKPAKERVRTKDLIAQERVKLANVVGLAAILLKNADKTAVVQSEKPLTPLQKLLAAKKSAER
jgi:hypothetical protein